MHARGTRVAYLQAGEGVQGPSRGAHGVAGHGDALPNAGKDTLSGPGWR